MTVCGWVARRREHGEHLAFVDLRDHTGIVQCVVDRDASTCAREYVVARRGHGPAPPGGHGQPRARHRRGGDRRLHGRASSTRPSRRRSRWTTGSRSTRPIRLRYRFVDLRRPRMQANLRLRAAVNAAIRAAMDRQGFVEVETPLLWAPTPEGAREFAVPSRLHHGSFYVLPQSPQLAKQLLMVAGFDRYYQIARCLRDEDLRADRQFEFTQLDMEASFVEPGGHPRVRVRGGARRGRGGDRRAARVRSPAHDLGRGHGPLRHRQARPAVRHGAGRPDRRCSPGTGFRAFAAPCVKAIVLAGGRRADPLAARRADRPGQGARRQGAGLVPGRPRAGTRRRRRLPGRQVPVRGRAGRSGGDRPARRRATWCWWSPTSTASTCYGARCAAARARRPAGRPRGPHRYLLGGRLPAVRRGGRRPATRWPPTTRSPCPTPTTSTGWRPTPARCAPRPTTWCSTAGSSARAASVIHRADIQRADLRRARHQRGGGRVPLRVPARRLPLRGAAARRVRRRPRPAGRHLRRRGEHPRGDRLPEDPVRARTR